MERINKPFVLTEQGLAVLGYLEDFVAIGGKDPWANKPEKKMVFRNGETIGFEEPSAEEIMEWKRYRDSYIRRREEYVCRRLSEEYGIEVAQARAKIVGLENFLENATPCGSQSDPQCSFYCKFYDEGGCKK